jgi:thiamine kinase-like enzyme
MGSIPVVESNAGLDRTYANLPVLVLRNYSDLTPQLLDRAYPCFLRHAEHYNYAHLTEPYWVNLVHTAVRTGKIDHVTEQHPFSNKYCDFL